MVYLNCIPLDRNSIGRPLVVLLSFAIFNPPVFFLALFMHLTLAFFLVHFHLTFFSSFIAVFFITIVELAARLCLRLHLF